jgi:hypothetical protein
MATIDRQAAGPVEIQARLAEAKVKVAASSVFRFLRRLGVTF